MLSNEKLKNLQANCSAPSVDWSTSKKKRSLQIILIIHIHPSILIYLHSSKGSVIVWTCTETTETHTHRHIRFFSWQFVHPSGLLGLFQKHTHFCLLAFLSFFHWAIKSLVISLIGFLIFSTVFLWIISINTNYSGNISDLAPPNSIQLWSISYLGNIVRVI